mmetsp:Transcript_57717/g.182842  ORF Transcript_57717/g.182842 Transcript_57717/m.182842 type:complete len:202 (-) Transcript_57717:327-932(-)
MSSTNVGQKLHTGRLEGDACSIEGSIEERGACTDEVVCVVSGVPWPVRAGSRARHRPAAGMEAGSTRVIAIPPRACEGERWPGGGLIPACRACRCLLYDEYSKPIKCLRRYPVSAGRRSPTPGVTAGAGVRLLIGKSAAGGACLREVVCEGSHKCARSCMPRKMGCGRQQSGGLPMSTLCAIFVSSLLAIFALAGSQELPR